MSRQPSLNKLSFDDWCEVKCSKFILSNLDNTFSKNLTPELILILLYKRHEFDVHKIRISATENSPIEKPNLTYENDLFPSLKDFLNKLNITLTDYELNKINALENDYNSQFDTGDDDE